MLPGNNVLLSYIDIPCNETDQWQLVLRCVVRPKHVNLSRYLKTNAQEAGKRGRRGPGVRVKEISNDKQDLTIHVDLNRQTLEGLYVSHHRVPHSLAVKFSTLFNCEFPENKVFPKLRELLRSPEPQVIPGGPGVRNAAFQPDILPRKDP